MDIKQLFFVVALVLIFGLTLAVPSGALAQIYNDGTSDQTTQGTSTDGSMTGDTATTTGAAGTTGTTPGAPNTGAGGNVQTVLLVLLTSAAIATAGATYLLRGAVRVR